MRRLLTGWCAALLFSAPAASGGEFGPADVSIENRLDASVWHPRSIKTEPGKPATLLIAEQLEIGDATFSYTQGTAPRNVYIFTKHLVIAGHVLFDLTSRKADDPDGGNLVIVAETTEVRAGAGVAVLSRGANGRDHEDMRRLAPRLPAPAGSRPGPLQPGYDGTPGGRGGAFILICPAVTTEKPIDPTVSLPSLPPTLGYPPPRRSAFDGSLFCLLAKRAFAVCNPGGCGGKMWHLNPDPAHDFAPDGNDGVLGGFETASEAAPYLPDWLLALHSLLQYENILHKLKEAVRQEDSKALFELFLQYKKASTPVIPQSLNGRYDATVSAIDGIRRSLPSLWSNTLTVQTLGVPRILQRFVERGALENRLAPTDLLLRPRKVGSREVLGLVRMDPGNPDRIQLSFDAELTLDPALAALANEQLAKDGQSVAGMFANWKLSAPQMNAVGLVGSPQMHVVGNVLQITLTLEAGAGNVALWELGGQNGLPITVHYECNGDPGVSGDLPLALSFARRTEPEIRTKGQFIRNVGRKMLSVEYVLLDGKAIPLIPALKIGPGEESKLPTLNRVSAEKAAVEVPAGAVAAVGGDPFSLEDFDMQQMGALVQSVDVRNLLRGYDEELRRPLENVEVKVTYTAGESAGSTEVTSGPYTLAASGATGSTVKVSFIRPNVGKYSFRVEGSANYDKGRTRRAIKIGPTENLIIEIDGSSLSN